MGGELRNRPATARHIHQYHRVGADGTVAHRLDHAGRHASTSPPSAARRIGKTPNDRMLR
jgi:hypothetical protein